MYNGLINVYKEAGWTSNDVVSKLRGILGQKKIGHTGTLDPDAEGVLVVCAGNGTKLVETLIDHDKEYIAVCRLGVVTDTQDMSGKLLEENDIKITSDEEVSVSEKNDCIKISVSDIKKAVKRFKGDYDQIPPMFSALKSGGRKLYELAREGREIERSPRRVHIHSISILDTSLLKTEHIFTMEVRCSKGTYIRTLCHDIGEALGCGAAMEHLTRTSVGSFRIEDAKRISDIQTLKDENGLKDFMLPVDEVFRDLDRIIVSNEALKFLKNGNPLKASQLISEAPSNEQDALTDDELYSDGLRLRVYDEDGVFYGIYKYDARKEAFVNDIFLYRNEA